MEIPTVPPTGTIQSSGGTIAQQHGQSKRNKIEKNMNEKVQVLPKQFNPDLVIAGHG